MHFLFNNEQDATIFCEALNAAKNHGAAPDSAASPSQNGCRADGEITSLAELAELIHAHKGRVVYNA